MKVFFKNFLKGYPFQNRRNNLLSSLLLFFGGTTDTSTKTKTKKGEGQSIFRDENASVRVGIIHQRADGKIGFYCR